MKPTGQTWPDEDHRWKEKEWERYANELVSMDHSLRGGSYQRIPDRNGDCGLEGIADTGDGYQSYADQGSEDADQRIQKQKQKIYTDLNKLSEFREFWTEYFGDRKLKRWTLLVPKFEDKAVVQHGKKRAKELKKVKLPFIDPSFDVYVKSIEDFPAAKLMVRDPRLPKGDGKPIPPGQIAAFKKKKPEFVKKIDDKLEKAMPTRNEEKREAYRESLLEWHLRSSNYLKELERYFPPQWEALEELIATTGRSIESEAPFDNRSASARLTETRRDFARTLEHDMKYIVPSDREAVSWGTLTLWLGICRLDFPETEDA
jgi:hypothetical protein